MQALNDYIVNSLPEIDDILSELTLAIKRTYDLFASIPFDEHGNAWGYQVTEGTPTTAPPQT
ncbi:hypothetical protein, partial [Rhodopseudomonas sp. BR0G17]|uniref:hypothetical protein n=1 Tax=Rhodopseudomonas sp. BR0G17 TaxID=2269368 RepID=UPI001968829F